MNVMDQYLNSVLQNLYVSNEKKSRLESDLRNHFLEGYEKGESDGEIVTKLGTPEEVAKAFMEEVSLEYAGFWRRLVAFFVDTAFCLDLILPLVLPVVLFVSLFKRGLGHELAIIPIISIVFSVLAILSIFILYFPLLESRFGRTLGKYLLGIRVIAESRTRIGFGIALLRRLSMFFEFLWLDALFIPFTEKKQRALDIVARTIVIREDAVRPTASDLLFIFMIFAGPFVGVGAGIALIMLFH